MARSVEQARGTNSDLSGAVAVPHGTGSACERLECIEAGHPVPDAGSLRAADRMRALIENLTTDDQVIALFSGGGSALLCAPSPGLSLAAKQALSNALLRSGATIREINAVRRAASRINAGRLQPWRCPPPVHTFLISDVAGDDPATIASGPTLTAPAAATPAVLRRYGIPVPEALSNGRVPPPPRSATTLERVGCTVRVICSPMRSLEAAAAAARERGFTPVILGDGIEGEAREMGRVQAGIAHSIARWGHPAPPHAVLLSGGEATVALKTQTGRGGPNAEFALGLADALQGHDHIHAIACDTDGIDGIEDNAGTFIGPDTLERARRRDLTADAHLANQDAYGFFEALDELVGTGPTQTNVNDFRAILVG